MSTEVKVEQQVEPIRKTATIACSAEHAFRTFTDGIARWWPLHTHSVGAMGAGNLTADLRLIRSKGFDGIRIWPLLFTGPQLMTADGSLSPDALTRLFFVLDRARDEHLVVDVSFTG